jgi:hypothetical protein
MKTIKIPTLMVATVLASLFGITAQAQSPFYSVNGVGGTGGGTAGVTVTPGTSPSGSSTLTDLGGSTQFSFGTGPGGVAGESIVNAATGQAGSGVLAGTLGASSSLSSFTVTMWVNLATASLNNYRILEISSGSPATTSSADGNKLFFGINAGGGLQTYVNNVNGNTTSTDIATAGTWNNGGTLGNIAANTWYFAAITYDTVGGTSLLYSGDVNDSATLAYTYNNLAGALDLSSASSISLSDRFSGGRNFPGAIDDVNIYNSALTPSQIEAIRASQVPEPNTLAIVGLGFGSLMTLIRRRQA